MEPWQKWPRNYAMTLFNSGPCLTPVWLPKDMSSSQVELLSRALLSTCLTSIFASEHKWIIEDGREHFIFFTSLNLTLHLKALFFRVSFCSSSILKQPFRHEKTVAKWKTLELPQGSQSLWPKHSRPLSISEYSKLITNNYLIQFFKRKGHVFEAALIRYQGHFWAPKKGFWVKTCEKNYLQNSRKCSLSSFRQTFNTPYFEVFLREIFGTNHLGFSFFSSIKEGKQPNFFFNCKVLQRITCVCYSESRSKGFNACSQLCSSIKQSCQTKEDYRFVLSTTPRETVKELNR